MHYFATAVEMARLDQLAIDAGLEVRQMMELAGWHMLEVFERLDIRSDKSVVIVCGAGNQAGDGLCAARHLTNNGFPVQIVLVADLKSNDALHHLRLIERMELPIYKFETIEAKQVIKQADVVIDAMIGYNLKDVPRNQFAEAINLINDSENIVISYDIPTGLDATSGQVHDPCIRAEATLTLGLMKKAFEIPEGREVSGTIIYKDIGIPKFIYKQISENV